MAVPLSDILSQRLRPSSQAAESLVGDETVILHLKSGIYYGLDATGTRIWALLKDGLAPSQICARIAGEFDVAPAQVEEDTRRFLSDLKANDLVQASEGTDG